MADTACDGGAGGSSSPPTDAGGRGQGASRNWRTRAWYPALRACGLAGKGITVHSLRHAYASMAIAAGADIKTLQRQLGHSSASITLDMYASLFPSRLSEVADAVRSMCPGNSRVTEAARKPLKHMTSMQTLFPTSEDRRFEPG